MIASLTHVVCGLAGVASCTCLMESVVSTDPVPALQFELDVDAIRLLHRSVSFHLEKWPGGPDPTEQQALVRMKTLLTAALLECSFGQDGQR